MSSFQFVNLPAEVRNLIYSLCTPLTGYMQDFKGLLLASKQIHAEYEYEAVNTISRLLDRVRKDWPHQLELRIQNPTKISDINSINVNLPVSLYYPFGRPSGQMTSDRTLATRLEPCLSPLFYLYLTQLTIGYYYDVKYERPDSAYAFELIPLGLLTDLTNILNPTGDYGTGRLFSPTRKSRRFRLDHPLCVRRLRYQWAELDGASSFERIRIVSINTRYFLNQETSSQQPMEKNLVKNWGCSNNNTIFFDIDC